MPNYRIQASLMPVTGLSADIATNTWYCIADDITAAIAFRDALVARYIAFSPNQSNSLLVAVGGLRMKIYNMADPEPRVPVSESSHTMTPGADPPMPTEVALVLSYRCDYTSGIPNARRRGRVYLPWFGELVNGTDARPLPAVVTALANFGDLLAAASLAATTWKWAQYSPTSDVFDIVVAGWVDNEWDTQRRRGRKATSRTNWTI